MWHRLPFQFGPRASSASHGSGRRPTNPLRTAWAHESGGGVASGSSDVRRGGVPKGSAAGSDGVSGVWSGEVGSVPRSPACAG